MTSPFLGNPRLIYRFAFTRSGFAEPMGNASFCSTAISDQASLICLLLVRK